MSRYNVEVDGWPKNLTLLVGWDEGLATYFAQLYDGNPYTDDSECLLWIGTAEIIPTPELLLQHLNASFSEGTPPVSFSKALYHQLEEDRLTSGNPDND